MREALKYLLAASAAAVLVFTVTSVGCTNPAGGGADAGDGGACAKNPFDPACKCNKAVDCDPLHPENKYNWLCPLTHQCTAICNTNADCTALASDDPRYAKYVCQDALCVAPICGSDSECGNGQICAGGTCIASPTADKVASCAVLPANGLVHQGATASFTVLAQDSDGNTVPYKGDVTWSVDQADHGSVAGSAIAGTLTGGTAAGSFSLKASIGSTACTAASVVNYASADAGKTRIVVADLVAHTPVSGATVVMGAQTTTTDANGIALFDGASTDPKTISVFDHDYAYLTMVGVTGSDLVAYLKPPAKAGSFTGSMTPRSFDALSDLKGTVHFALYGGSIPGNLIDIQLSTLLGDMVDTKIDLGSQSATVPLPEGTIIGLGEQMFKQDYTVLAPVGTRTIWGIGGNMDFSAITKALGPVLSGGSTSNLDIGGILTSLLPLLGKLQSGVLTGITSNADATTPIGDKMKLDTPLRLNTVANLPTLPTYTSVSGDTTHFDGAIVLGGALYSPQGLVPLGLTAGIDQAGGDPDPNDPTKTLPDGKIDPAGDNLQPGQLALRLAPLHGGLETSKYVGLALAASFKGLVGSSGSSSGPSDGIVLSGIVTYPGDITYSPTTPQSISFGDHFLGVPNPTLTDREFSLGSTVAGAAFHRIDIGDDASGEWTIYLPAGSTPATFDIPTPPEGFDDRLMAAAGATKQPTVLVQSVQLGGGTGSLDYNGMATFNSENMDDLTNRINTFSVRQISRPAPGN